MEDINPDPLLCQVNLVKVEEKSLEFSPHFSLGEITLIYWRKEPSYLKKEVVFHFTITKKTKNANTPDRNET